MGNGSCSISYVQQTDSNLSIRAIKIMKNTPLCSALNCIWINRNLFILKKTMDLSRFPALFLKFQNINWFIIYHQGWQRKKIFLLILLDLSDKFHYVPELWHYTERKNGVTLT